MTIYESTNDFALGRRRRRLQLVRYSTNYFYMVPEWVGYNAAIYSTVPRLFSQHRLLRVLPGFDLGLADVWIEFPEGDYTGTWEITIDYDITPIDRLRSWFNVGELQETVATLSAEVLELQRDRKALSEEAEHLAGRLVEEEKARRVYQVRAAQADAVARFLHQTSNLVLQPLASTMIVFEDLMEIAADCRIEWGVDHQGDELLQELDEGLARVKETYPTASRVIEGYRELFHAFYEVYVSTQVERDVNQDLRYIETLVRNKYILTQVGLDLELDPEVPPLRLEGGMQSIFLELMQNATQHGARQLLVRSVLDPERREVHLFFYNDGQPIPQGQWDRVLNHGIGKEGQGFGLADARYIVETLNGGRLRLIPSDRDDFAVLFAVDLPVEGCGQAAMMHQAGAMDEARA
jgi:FtsZ-binding cell division protein ZapB